MAEAPNYPEKIEAIWPDAEEQLNFGEIFPADSNTPQAGEVVNQLIHDARDPLQLFTTLREMLKMILPPSRQQEIVPIVERGVEHMESVLRNAAGTTPRRSHLSSVYQTLRKSLENGWIDDIKKKTGRTDWEVLLEPLSADLEQIPIISSESGWKGSILPNFVSNAVQADARNIVIRFIPYDDYGTDAVAVEIIDDGHGMSQQVIDKLLKGEWHSSGKTMRDGDATSDHNHGFPSAKRIILSWGSRLRIHSRQASKTQPGKTIMRIIFNGAMSKHKDFPDVLPNAKKSTAPLIPTDVLAQLMLDEESTRQQISSTGFNLMDLPDPPLHVAPSPSTTFAPEDLEAFVAGHPSISRVRANRRAMIGATLAAGFSLVMGGTYAVISGRRRTTSAQNFTSSASTPDVITEPEIPLMRPPSRIQYDERGQMTVVEGNGWIYEREGNISSHVKISEIRTSTGQILAFESQDYKKYPMPRLAVCNVDGRTFGYINTGKSAGYFAATYEVGRSGEIIPSDAVALTDTVYGPQGLRASKIEMLTSEILGKQDDALQKFVSSVLQTAAEKGMENARQIAMFLDRAMRIRDARTVRDMSIDTLEELFSYLQDSEPLFAILQPSVKEQLRKRPFSYSNIRKAQAPGIHLCFPATNTQEAETYVDLKS